MTREEVKSILPDVTDVQPGALMNLHGAGIEKVNAAKAAAEQKLAGVSTELETAKGTIAALEKNKTDAALCRRKLIVT